MDGRATRPRVLLAEDDLVSRVFLCEAIEAYGGLPIARADGLAALASARARHWDLLILDHRLPGLDGDAVLAALRASPRAAARHAPAIATTAGPDPVRATLLQAGFDAVLPKPLSLEVLYAALARHAGRVVCVLDDAAALRACGSPTTARRLRRLFAEQELPRVQGEFDRDDRTRQALCGTLHRLHASCGFCGAPVLARAGDALHAALATEADPDRIDGALQAFRTALQDTRVALRAQLGDDE